MKGVPVGKDYLTHRREKGVKRAEQNARNRLANPHSSPTRPTNHGNAGRQTEGARND